MAQLLSSDDLHGRTQLLVLQGTPFCNIDCSYCYLPDRTNRSRMSFDTLRQAIHWLYRENLPADPMTVVWHAGEPLVLPVDWYEQAFAIIAAASPRGRLYNHSIQTNGMLLSEPWCDFVLEHSVNLGVSIDGPAFLHDARRQTRRGDGTHAAVMGGLALLQRRGVPFYVICVITRDTLDFPDQLIDFFLGLGIHSIGFNIEEIEGANATSSMAFVGIEMAYRRFFDRVVDRVLSCGECVHLREVENIGAFLLHPFYGRRTANSQNTPFEILTVTWRGDILTYSPELAGQRNARYGDFVLGNVGHDELSKIVVREPFVSLQQEIEAGTAACRETCPYFDLCLGGAPANKIAEYGRFDTAETLFCRLTTKAVVDTALSKFNARCAATLATVVT